MPLKPGDKAPDFALPDQHDQQVALKSLRGRRALVYFYPKADTPGCTKQACGLNEVLGDIGDTAVIGISPDKPSKQLKFAEKYSLGFPLLSDPDHGVAELRPGVTQPARLLRAARRVGLRVEVDQVPHLLLLQ